MSAFVTHLYFSLNTDLWIVWKQVLQKDNKNTKKYKNSLFKTLMLPSVTRNAFFIITYY